MITLLSRLALWYDEALQLTSMSLVNGIGCFVGSCWTIKTMMQKEIQPEIYV